MKIKSFLFAALFFAFAFAPSVSSAENMKKFFLKDGSIIQAEIIAYSKGVYQLRSNALGKFNLSEDKIKSVEFSPGASPTGGVASTSESGDLVIDAKQVNAMKHKIMSDPQATKLAEELQKDPAVQQILGDKDLMQALEKGDLGRLASDPKILSLMNNKEVGKIIERAK